ncbi:MAG TPA: hypothetical protein VFG15_16940 [Amycolatopsis sp.]|nr:hypothetical protein [Amycolatopsis sp.]
MLRRTVHAVVAVPAAAVLMLGVHVPAHAASNAPADTRFTPAASPVTHPGIASRGDRRRADQVPPEETPQDEQPDECPTELWVVPIEIEGVACILVLRKHEEEPAAGA